MFEPIFDDFSNNGAVIKVIGVGGGGGNALNHMVLSADTESMSENDMGSVEFFSVNRQFFFAMFKFLHKCADRHRFNFRHTFHTG